VLYIKLPNTIGSGPLVCKLVVCVTETDVCMSNCLYVTYK